MRARLRKFTSLSASHWFLLATATIALIRGRICVTFLPIWQILRPVSPQATTSSRDMSPEKIGWAVETAARIVPTGSNCLVRAIAGRAMLARYGFPSQSRLGVRKNYLEKLEGTRGWNTAKR